MITAESQVTSKEKSLQLQKGLGENKKTMLSWYSQKDGYGVMWVLDDNFYDNVGIPAYTVPELIDLLPPMSTLTFLIFCFRTRLKPDAVADYVMSKL